MFTVQNFSASGVATAAASDRPLSDSELALLRDEYTRDPVRRGYAGTSGEALAALLCQPYTIPNPVPQGRVPKASVPGDAVKGFLFRSLPVIEGNAELAAKWGPRLGLLVSMVTAVVDLTDAGFAAQIGAYVAQAVQDGLFSQEAWDEMVSDPDPAWQNELSFDSRLMQVLGIANAVLTASDLAQVAG